MIDCATPARDKSAHGLCSTGMRIEFLKMQGLGNDFLVFDAPAAAADTHLDSSRLRALADRHTGIGFDQALMLETPRDAGSRVFYRIFNSDGTEVEQCGNGARCAVEAPLYWLKVDGADVESGAVSMGNPHAVLQVSDVKTAPVARFGPS